MRILYGFLTLVLTIGFLTPAGTPAEEPPDYVGPAQALVDDAPAPNVAGKPLPDLRATTLSVPWQEFKALLEQIQPESDKKIEPPPPPPFEWTIADAEYTAEDVDGHSVRVQAEFAVTVLKPKGWVKVPLLGSDVATTSVSLDGEKTSLALAPDGWSTLVLDTPGEHTVQAEFFVPLSSDEGVVSFEFPCPKTPLTRMTLRVPASGAVVSSPNAANVKVSQAEAGLTAELAFRSTETIAVNWTLPAKLRPEAPAVPEVEPRVTCLVSTLATITDRFISCRSALRFDVLRGQVDTFRIRLPDKANVLDVSGQGAGWSQPADRQQNEESPDQPSVDQLVEVKVNHEIEDRYELVLTYEAPFEDEMATLTTPHLGVENVVRQTGFIAVNARTNVEVTPGPGIEGLNRVDVTELPTALRAMSPSPILLAYKHAEPDYLLSLDVRKLEDVPVRPASIDRAILTTMVTDDGTTLCRAYYEVRNNVKQFLRLDLPEDAKVLSAEVGGEVIKPARESEEDGVLIPLFKSAVTNRQLAAFPVEVLYMGPQVSSLSLFRPVGLTAPATDIPVNEYRWEVLLPEKRCLYRATGDLKTVDASSSVTRLSVARTAPRSSVARTTSGSREETVYRLREGIERFYIQDINNAAASSGGKGNKYEGAPITPPEGGPPRAGVAVAGVLPVRIDLPLEGVAHHFRRIIVPENESLSLSIHTYPARLRVLLTVLRFIVWLLGICVAVFIARALWRRMRRYVRKPSQEEA